MEEALVNLEINVRKLAELISRRDEEAKRLVNLILQDAYTLKSALETHTDAYDRCKASPMIYAHVKF